MEWKQGRFHRLATPGSRPGSTDHFYALDPTQKLINTLTKRKIWAKSENSHTQIGLEKDIYLLIAHYWRIHLSYFNGLIVQIDPLI